MADSVEQERRGNVGMMGQQAGNQERLFYTFNLEEHVPADHLLQGIDTFLDLSALRQQLAPFYSHTGRDVAEYAPHAECGASMMTAIPTSMIATPARS
jgi:hypothetical protein